MGDGVTHRPRARGTGSSARGKGCKKSAQKCGHLRLLLCSNDSTRDGTFVRWSTRCVRPRSALAKTPCADGAVWSFFLMSALVQARWSTRCVRPRSALAKTPCADGAFDLFSYVSARASTVEHAMRAPPFGTRKNALHRWRSLVFFLMSALVQARCGHKKNAHTPSE